jgi:hypothetical protein
MKLIRKSSELSSETAGEHFTLQAVIRVMVNLRFTHDAESSRGQRSGKTSFPISCPRAAPQFSRFYHCVAAVRDLTLNTMGSEDLLHDAVLAVFALLMWRLVVWRLGSRLIE